MKIENCKSVPIFYNMQIHKKYINEIKKVDNITKHMYYNQYKM